MPVDSVESLLCGFLPGELDGMLVQVAPDRSSYARDRFVTVRATAANPIRGGRAVEWVTDFDLFDKDRAKAFDTAYQILTKIRTAVEESRLAPVTSFSIVSMPIVVANNGASQEHAVVSFAVSLIARTRLDR